MEEEVISKVEELLKKMLEQGINQNNIEFIYKLSKIKHMAKEDEKMQGNYGEYGRRGYGEGYGEYRGYGRRGYDAKYRGYDELDRIGNNYGRYMDSRDSYGAEESLRSMLECMKEFGRVVREQAKTPEEKQMIETAFKEM